MFKWLQFWKKSSSVNKRSIFKGLFAALSKGKLTSEIILDIERQLISADVGVSTTAKIIDALKHEAANSDLEVKPLLKTVLSNILSQASNSLDISNATPHVIMMVGINGVGKTTTSAKLANLYKQQGKKVMLVAADTFRAAATEQLKEWARKLNVPIVSQQIGADSSAVLYDALESSKAKKVEVMIADTAGRLENKSHLMEELAKNIRVLKKIDNTAPHSICLVVDGNNGQNILNQVKEFSNFVQVTNIICTKCDSSAKAGVLLAVAASGIPISFLGTGEAVDDLHEFDVQNFVDNLLN